MSISDRYIGKKVIVRTYSAGNWFGTVSELDDTRVVLTEARRMWRWWAKQSISLSGCALYGVHHEAARSKIISPVPSVLLDMIEIIECTPEAIESLETAPFVEQT